ncbi:MAG: hypothetical protein AAF349_12455 [Cyanobacteria bacterium P01_A01_bin.68]
MMRMTNKLVLATSCLVIFSAVAVKPVSAVDNDLSEQLIAQSSFNDEPIIEDKAETREENAPNSGGRTSSDESWIMPILWGLGGYMIGSLVGTNKTYTKMNKGR